MNKLNLLSPISSLGYGVAGVNILKNLSNYDVALFLLGNLEGTEAEIELARKALAKAEVFDGFNGAPCLKIWHEFSMAERIGQGPLFAFPFFEIDKFDARRINHLQSTDHIIVASEWAKGIMQQNCPKAPPISVAPLGVDTSVFTARPYLRTDKCVFLNCGKWEKRKGHDLLLEMFKTAFPHESDVELQMMTHNPFLSEHTGLLKHAREWERYYRSDPRVRLIGRVPTHAEVAQIMGSADCGIFPSRAEGWNLELLEMMAMGKHVIATDYSAHTQFCNQQNADLIDITNMEVAHDGVFFVDSLAQWASLSGGPFKQGVEYLRSFYERWRSGEDQYNTAGVETAKQFSWKNTAKRIEEIIDGSQGSKTI